MSKLTDAIDELDEELPKYDDYSVMPFGKYKGEEMVEIPDSYLEWLLNNFEGFKSFPGLEDYINERI